MASGSQYHPVIVKMLPLKNVSAHRLGTHGPDFQTIKEFSRRIGNLEDFQEICLCTGELKMLLE